MREVWRQLNRKGTDAARCTVTRMMADMGLAAAIRGRSVKTMTLDPAGPCPRDRVHRESQALHERRPVHDAGLVHHSGRGA